MVENRFDPSVVAIAGITYYPKWYSGKLRSIKHTDKIRGDLTIESCKIACKLGYHVIVIDGKSTATYKKEIAKIPGITLIKRRAKKRSPNKRRAIMLAAQIPGVKVIIQTEIEKLSFVKDCLPFVAGPILADAADIVIPKREPKLFATSYPEYMHDSEAEGNRLYNEALRAYGLLQQSDEDLDVFFGPRAFRNDKKIINLFMKRYHIDTHNISFPREYFDLEEMSNAQYFPLILALKKKMRLVTVTVPFVYPQLQKDNEEKGARELFLEKRKAQRLSLIVELLHFLSFLDKNPGSRLKKIA